MNQVSSIRIKNVYYMLSYAFHGLNLEHNKQLETEEFEHIHDLFAAILASGISKQLKQGLYREYVVHVDELTTLRGKIELAGTVRLQIAQRRALHCEYDELSEDNMLNQILKVTGLLLLRHGRVSRERKASLKKVMLFFAGVSDIEPASIRWNSIRFARNNRSYRMLTSVCQLVIEGLLLTTERGEHALMSFLDDQAMSRLYEKFILEYFITHWPSLRPRASQIEWALDAGERTMLPVMQSDITLTAGTQVLIIDAKYYAKNTQERFERHSVHSANLYQIFTYVKNKEIANPECEVAGMLLYARTEHEVQADADWRIGGSQIRAQTLDLSCDFSSIAEQFDGMVAEHFALGLAERVA